MGYEVETSSCVETMQTPITTVRSESKDHGERWVILQRTTRVRGLCVPCFFFQNPPPLYPCLPLYSLPSRILSQRHQPLPATHAHSHRRSLLLSAPPALPAPRPPPPSTATPSSQPLAMSLSPPPPSSPLQRRHRSTRWRGPMSTTLMERLREHDSDGEAAGAGTGPVGRARPGTWLLMFCCLLL
jgi:hypothetical protein